MPGVSIGTGAVIGAATGAITGDVAQGAGYGRNHNHAGGLEGGVTNGEPLVCRVHMKPISTLMNPLETVDVSTGQSAKASTERSDTCAVPAAAIVAECAVAIVLAQALLEKTGGDSIDEQRRNLDGYIESLAQFRGGS